MVITIEPFLSTKSRVVTETSNQRGEVVQVVTATIVVPRRPEDVPPGPA